MTDKPVHIDVCSGVGCFGIAAAHAGYETAAFCEIEPYPRRVLARHFPKAYIHDDLKTLTGDTLRSRGIDGVGLFTGGIPCQPFSVSGEQEGAEDERHLWPEAYRLTTDIRPTWVCIENVGGFVPMALDLVLSQLEEADYTGGAVLLPACSVDAPHRRDRVWVVAHANEPGRFGGRFGKGSGDVTQRRTEAIRRGDTAQTAGFSETLGDAGGGKLSGQSWRGARTVTENGHFGLESGNGNAGPTQPGMGRDAHGPAAWLDGLRWPAPLGASPFEWEPPRTAIGVKNRMVRLKACGNAIVWPVAAVIFAAIRDAMENNCEAEV